MAWIVEVDKKFVIIGNMNAITYKEVFPLIKEDKMWLGNGFNAGNAYFASPKSRDWADGVFDSKTGLVKFRNVVWFSNLEHGKRHEPLSLMSQEDNLKFSRHNDVKANGYQKYDNYDALEVPYTDAIPSDYEGVMGVPISFLSKYNPDQFALLGMSGNGEVPSELLIPRQLKYDRPYLAGTRMYVRLFIRHRKVQK